MTSSFSSSLPQDMTESANLLDSNSCQENEHLYHEMEMSEGVTVEIKDSEPRSMKYILAAIVASLGGVLFGYDLGIVSGAILQLKGRFNLDCQQQEMVVSSMLFGALLGSLLGGHILDYFGRRKTIMVNAFVFFVGALILALSPSYALLIFGRLIVGFGTSLSAIAECIYIAEIAPPKRRGLLVSLNEIGIASGLLMAYLINYIFINFNNGWRFMFGLSGVPALIQGIGIIFLPPSPRWLICQGQDVEALKVLRTLNHGSSPEEEISKIKDALNKEHSFNVCYLFGQHQNMRDRMLVGLGLAFFQQFTGQPSVLYYAPLIFENIGFHSHSAATLATVGIGITKLLATIVTLSLVDKAGRRRFLLYGSILMTFSIFILYAVTLSFPGGYHQELCQKTPTFQPQYINHSLLPSFSPYNMRNTSSCTPVLIHTQSHSQLISKRTANSSTSVHPSKTTTIASSSTTNDDDHHFKVKLICFSQLAPIMTNISSNHSKPTHSYQEQMPSAVKYVTVLCLMMFAGAYSCGYGPVTWLVLSEIFPMEIKGRAFAATTVLNWGSNLIVSLTMLDLIDSIGASWTFFIYGTIGCLATIFIYKVVPETKNRSLEEINALFSTRNPLLEKCLCSSTNSCCGEHYSSVSTSTPRDTGLLLEGDEWQI